MIMRNKILARAQSLAKGMKSAVKVTAAGGAAAALLVGNLAKSAWNKASTHLPTNKKDESAKGVIVMKKSTLIAMLVGLAAILGALVALYFYLIRREKELEEYEQLLFNEDTEEDFADLDSYKLPADVLAEAK